jgi:hypothetical protein
VVRAACFIFHFDLKIWLMSLCSQLKNEKFHLYAKASEHTNKAQFLLAKLLCLCTVGQNVLMMSPIRKKLLQC